MHAPHATQMRRTAERLESGELMPSRPAARAGDAPDEHPARGEFVPTALGRAHRPAAMGAANQFADEQA
jgi:hypothetical protein